MTIPEGWTLDTLRTHLEARLADMDRRYGERFAAQEEATRAALAAADKASSKAESAAEKRFEGVNEFRGQLSDQAATLMPRAESTTLHQATRERLDALVVRIERAEGRGAGMSAIWGYLVAGVGLLATGVALYAALRR